MSVLLGMISGMFGPAKSQQEIIVRDDNLRLIFSETELKIIDEKRKDVISGFYALAAVFFITLLISVYFYATPLPARLIDTQFELISVGLGLIGLIGALITLVSPIIIIGLLIELRLAAKARASLIALLMKYRRPVPKD